MRLAALLDVHLDGRVRLGDPVEETIEVVASVGDGSEAVAACDKHEPQVVLMDYRLPMMDGVQTTVAVKAAHPEIAVVCLTASANSREIEALYEAGATACLTKDQELDDIVDAVKRAANGLG